MSRSVRAVATLVLALLVPLALAACGPAHTGPASGGTATQTPTATAPPPASHATPVAPGVYDISGGRVRVVGTLVHSQIEGGFWGIVAGKSSTESAPLTVVVTNAAQLRGDLTSLRGTTVVAEGSLHSGPSIRMVGPEMRADSLVPQRDYRPSEQGTPHSF